MQSDAITPIAVREMRVDDIDLIADYWLLSEPAFLEGMGVDISKLPDRKGLSDYLNEQLRLPYHSKNSYALIWLYDGNPIGHCNLTDIIHGQEASMHLHMWNSDLRQKGIGTELLRSSLPWFFRNTNVKRLICEPYALNPAPIRTLPKVGFRFEKEYRTTPGSLSAEQLVQRWILEA
jgi:RimJ/RimL family protein N-acetyltransferase